MHWTISSKVVEQQPNCLCIRLTNNRSHGKTLASTTWDNEGFACSCCYCGFFAILPRSWANLRYFCVLSWIFNHFLKRQRITTCWSWPLLECIAIRRYVMKSKCMPWIKDKPIILTTLSLPSNIWLRFFSLFIFLTSRHKSLLNETEFTFWFANNELANNDNDNNWHFAIESSPPTAIYSE